MAFLSRLLEASVPLAFVDLPAVEEPTGRFLLQSMAAVAELEAGLISDRTRKALAEAKARGVRLGGSRGYNGSPEHCAIARASLARRAGEQARALAPLIERMDPEGRRSLGELARALQAEGVPTVSGKGRRTAEAVSRLRSRLEALHDKPARATV